MTVIDLVVTGSRRTHLRIVGLGALAGLGSTAALVIVNAVAQAPERATMYEFGLFALSVAVSLVAMRRASRRMIDAVERALLELKTRLIDKIRAARLAELERVGHAEIHDRLSENLSVVSFGAGMLGPLVQSLSVLLLALVYLVALSPGLLALLSPLLIAGVIVYRARQREVIDLLARQHELRLRFLSRLLSMIRGAKELKLSRARARDVGGHFEGTSAELRDLSAEIARRWDDNELFLTGNQLAMLAFVVFVFARLFALESTLLGPFIVALMFAWGSVQGSIFGYTRFVEANFALAQLAALEAKLDVGEPEQPAPLDDAEARADASRVEAAGVEYRYPGAHDEPGFQLGPIDLTVDPGEVVFIVGGNGAGKSTLLKLLTGLYTPTRGVLRVAGLAVGPHNIAAYRERLSVIFSDVHLFRRAYGLLDAAPEEVERRLNELGIAHKTAFTRGRFTNLELSTGQRKRLAMVLALLEDRPIVVLDEWAADQDPEFREYFYKQLIPSLKRQGKTVIAVSHDDRYFDCADRVITLEYGALRAALRSRA